MSSLPILNALNALNALARAALAFPPHHPDPSPQ